QRLARGPARDDLLDLALVVVVGEQVEVEVLAQHLLGEDRDAAEVVEAPDAFRCDPSRLEELAVIANVRLRVMDEAAEALQLELLDLLARQPLRPSQLVELARSVPRAAGRRGSRPGASRSPSPSRRR